MDDSISRQAAIDALHDYFDGMLETDTICPKDIYNLFEIIPSVEAESVIHCKDCLFGHRYWDVINGYEDTWVECRNPDGLYRDVSIDGYCSGGVRKGGEQNDIR